MIASFLGLVHQLSLLLSSMAILNIPQSPQISEILYSSPFIRGPHLPLHRENGSPPKGIPSTNLPASEPILSPAREGVLLLSPLPLSFGAHPLSLSQEPNLIHYSFSLFYTSSKRSVSHNI